MLTVQRNKIASLAEWRALLSGLQATPLHLPEVMGVGSPLDTFEQFLFYDGDLLEAAGYGLVVQQRRFKFFKGGLQLHCPVFPAMRRASGELAVEVCQALRDEARHAGYQQLEIDARWGQDFSGNAGLQPFLQGALYEFTVDLQQDWDLLVQAMHKKHRKNLRGAETYGLEVVEDSSLEAFMKLRDMQQSSSERAAEHGNRYGIQGDEFFRAVYESNYRNGPGRVLYALHQGEYVAALAFLTYDRKAVTVRSGSTPSGYQTLAMYLLQVELFRRLKSEGFQLVNIGGVPVEAAQPGHPQHGLYDYKRYYGGQQCLRTGLMMTLQ